MNIKLLIVILLGFSLASQAQRKMEIKAEMPDYAGDLFLLLSGDDGGVFVVDSARVGTDGDLTFSWQGNTGFYRIANRKEHLDFRMQKSNFWFSLNGSIEDGDLQFADKDENYEYQYYLSEFNMLNRSLLKLREELQDRNENDSLYKAKYSQFKDQKKEKKNLLKDLWGAHIDSWAARYVLAQQEIFPDVKLKKQKADDFYSKHFFDYFAFSDSLLTGTPVYYEKIGKYLHAHSFDKLIQQENFRAIKELVGNLFWLTELDPASQKYLVNYLMNRYPEEQYFEVYHIVKDAYQLLNTCEYVLNTNTIRRRINSARSIKKGWQVPDITLYHSNNGRINSLSDVNSEMTLLIVWSASCEHSVKMLSQVYDLYYMYKDLGLEILAISLDNNLNYWQRTVAENAYPWINTCDTNGLNSDIANQLSIYVTPNMLLIDSSLRVVETPQTIFQLEKKLNEVFR